MSTRMRSPRYPGTSLGQCIDYIEKIHKLERTNPIDREVAAQAMGYSGISGRSSKMLADLNQYGLLEKGSKNEVRVSKQAVEILHPESPRTKYEALRAAALEPELFQRISERFPDGKPSEASLRSYFVREEFTDAAIPSAIRAYTETMEFLEYADGSGSHGVSAPTVPESVQDQPIKDNTAMQTQSNTLGSAGNPEKLAALEMNLDWVNKRGWVHGHIASKVSARQVIDFANAIMATLPDDAEKDEQPIIEDGSDGSGFDPNE